MDYVKAARCQASLSLVAVCAPLVLTGTIVCAADERTSPQTPSLPRVRSTDAVMLELLREGAERSITFAALLAAIGRSNDIVYVEFGYCAFGHVDGCLLPFIASAHGGRYLRVLVTPDRTRRTGDQLLALIAHELQHAREVTEHPEVVDVATMEAMFHRIGSPLHGLRGYETSAARGTGDAVLRELSRTSSVRRE